GLRVGDLVLAVGPHEIEDEEALRFRIATLEVGSTAVLTILRNGRERKIEVKLAPPPERPPRDVTELRGRHPLSGATVANLSPALADELGIDLSAKGVIVLNVAQGSAAQRIGLQPGDIIAGLDGRPVETVAQLRERLQRTRSVWAFTIKRGGRLLNLQIQG